MTAERDTQNSEGTDRAVSAQSAAARGRIGWVDTGRGVAITLVVLVHAAQWLEAAGFDTRFWEAVNEPLVTLRMPLFFSIAGMFAAKWLVVSWGQLWSGKVSLFAWVFMLWGFIATGPFILGLIMQGESGNFLSQYQYVVTAPVKPRFELWFLWALSLFFVVSRLIKFAPRWSQMAFAGALSTVFLSGPTLGNVAWDSSLKYFFFFLLGLHYRSWIMRVGESKHVPFLVVTCAAWLVMAVSGAAFGLNDTLPGFRFLTSLLGVVTGVCLSRILARWRRVGDVGRQTLPIYLTHTSLILLIAWFLHYLPVWTRSGPVVGFFAVPLIGLMAMVIGLWLARTADKWPLSSYLFQQPAWFAHGTSRRSQGKIGA